MNEPNETTGIPEDFWSAYSEQPFDACIQCSAPLNEEPIPYAIQKHYVAGEAVFEMAICIACASRLQGEFSKHSREAIAGFVRKAPERRRREDEFSRADDEAPADETKAAGIERIEWLAQVRRERAMGCCAICARPRNECHRYSLGTACFGLSAITAAPSPDDLGSPFLICGDCESHLNECISQQTRDAWDRFVGENFMDGPPGLALDPRELIAMF